MAQPVAALSGSERIRALTDEAEIFKAFDSYPWKKDRMFMSGLYAILGDPNSDNPRGTPVELAAHARIFYYAQRIGVTIDFTKYKEWVAQHPEQRMPDVLPEEFTSATGEISEVTAKLGGLSTATKKEDTDPQDASSPSESILAWQAAAPKAPLYVERRGPPQHDGPGQGEDPSYPIAFAEMLEMLQKGIPIPGIKQIPDTVIRDPAVKPFGARMAPRKPWEKANPPTEADPGTDRAASAIDHEFPPLEADESAQS